MSCMTEPMGWNHVEPTEANHQTYTVRVSPRIPQVPDLFFMQQGYTVRLEASSKRMFFNELKLQDCKVEI